MKWILLVIEGLLVASVSVVEKKVTMVGIVPRS